VLAYHRQGLRHLKLYWRLREPEFRAALAAADSLGLRAYAHLDQNVVSMDTALALGLRHFEHLLTLDHGVLAFPRDTDAFTAHMRRHYGEADPGFVAVRLEMFRFIREHRAAQMDALLQRLAARHATFSTSIHVLAEPLQLAYFAAQQDSTLRPGGLTPAQLVRGQENFRLLLRYAKQLADRGVALRLGSDCAKGGQAVQSEQLLLFENGFSVAQILQISTLNGATALGLDQAGVIEAGSKANLVVFDHSPFANYQNFRSSRTIVKDGVVWRP
jgi:imidazolonepropionase-like amidohydrolase